MALDPLLVRAREVWVNLTGVPVAFPDDGGLNVVVSAGSLLCPPQWVGVVVLGDAAIAAVPTPSPVGVVRAALDGLPVSAMTEVDRLRAQLALVDVRGPATLAYLDGHDFRPVDAPVVEELAADDGDLATFLASVAADDADESGLADITSSAFGVRDGTDIVAAAGYRRWSGGVAHLSVLTAAKQRGRGLARVVASAAVRDALENRLLPQWRARPEPSRRVARALGFRQLGAQLSFRVEF